MPNLSGLGAVAMFVKTPALSPVKTRLAATIGSRAAALAYAKCLDVTRELLATSAARAHLVPYWAVAEAAAMTPELWPGFDRIGQGDGGLGARLHRVYQTLLKRHPFVLLIGADCPQMPAACLDAAAQQLQPKAATAAFVLGLARDGGFYLFGGRQAVAPDVFASVVYSCDQTAAMLHGALRGHGLVTTLALQLTDLDTQADWPTMREELHSCQAQGYRLLPSQVTLLQAPLPGCAASTQDGYPRIL